MEQYINKADIEKEIERIKKEECPVDSYEGRCKLLWFEQFLSFINTLEVKEVENIWHPMSEPADHPCNVLMHGYGNDVWIADAVETLEQSTAQEWAYMDDVLKMLKL